MSADMIYYESDSCSSKVWLVEVSGAESLRVKSLGQSPGGTAGATWKPASRKRAQKTKRLKGANHLVPDCDRKIAGL